MRKESRLNIVLGISLLLIGIYSLIVGFRILDEYMIEYMIMCTSLVALYLILSYLVVEDNEYSFRKKSTSLVLIYLLVVGFLMSIVIIIETSLVVELNNSESASFFTCPDGDEDTICH